jgi:hypothetical protein
MGSFLACDTIKFARAAISVSSASIVIFPTMLSAAC